MGTYDSDAMVLRAIRYSEADNVLTLYTRDRGRVAAIVKGARRPKSRLGGRLQPGAVARVTVAEGRRGLGAVRGATLIEPHAGLWVEANRLRAAGCVLEAAFRTLPDDDPNEPAYNLLLNAVTLIARSDPFDGGHPRLDPLVLGADMKLLVVAGLLPALGACVGCGAGPPFLGFSAERGGVLCERCADGAVPLTEAGHTAVAALLGRPLAEAREACPPGSAAEVERIIGLVLREHLGVTLRSAAAPE